MISSYILMMFFQVSSLWSAVALSSLTNTSQAQMSLCPKK